MEAPKEIYLNYYGESAMWNERIESCDKAVKYIRADKAVDKDALLEWVKEKQEQMKVEAGGCSNMLAAGKYLAYKEIIDRIESL